MCSNNIQIIRDTLGGFETVSPVDKGVSKVSRDIFSEILNHIFVISPAFLKEKASFSENQKSRHTEGSAPVSPNDTRGRWGSKIGRKSVTYYLNGPLLHAAEFPNLK